MLPSTDLQHWRYAGDALPVLPPWERAGQTWAPGVVILGDPFVMYYATDRAQRRRGVHLGGDVARPRCGPFVDLERRRARSASPTSAGRSIPNPSSTPTGTPYLYWKSDGGDGALPIPGDIWVAQLSPDGSTVVGEAVNVLTETQSWETTVENPFMVYESGAYVLFYSAGLWNSAGYGGRLRPLPGPDRSLRQTASGPLLHSDAHRLGPGGESLVTDAQGNWWMAYAAWDGPASDYSYAAGDFRSLWIAPVTFTGPTPVIGAGEAPEGYDMSASDGGIFSFGARRLPRVHGRPAARRPHRGHGRRPGRWRLLAGGPRRRASSPSATPASTARWGATG